MKKHFDTIIYHDKYSDTEEMKATRDILIVQEMKQQKWDMIPAVVVHHDIMAQHQIKR